MILVSIVQLLEIFTFFINFSYLSTLSQPRILVINRTQIKVKQSESTIIHPIYDAYKRMLYTYYIRRNNTLILSIT